MSITHEAYLNIVPGDSPAPIIKVSQYDADFSIVFHLIAKKRGIVPAYPRTVQNDEDVTINVPTSATVSVRGTKTDGNGYSANATLSGTATAPIVTVAGHEQMTASAGVNVYEITFYANNATKRLSTANFILFVEPAALDASTITSESLMLELNDLIAAVPNAVAAADRAEAAAQSVEEVTTQVATNTQDISDIKADLSEIFSDTAKEALLACFEHVAWTDEHGQDYYDALENALFSDAVLVSLTATFAPGSNVIYDITPLNDLKAYLVVTGLYSDGTSKPVSGYTLSGTLSEGENTITVAKGSITTTFSVTVEKYWTYEWNYTDGLPSDNGLTKTVVGNVTETMTDDGLRVVVENTSDKKVTYTYNGLLSTDRYTQGIFELEFVVNAYGSYSYSPYGNGVRLYAALGNRDGNALNCAELTCNTSGVMYLKTGTTNWTVLNSTPFDLDTLYKLRIEQSETKADIYVNGELVGTIQSADIKETVVKPQFLLNRGPDVTFKSYKLRMTV